MSHFLEKRDRWGNSLSLWMILAAIFITPLCFWSLRHMRMENDIDHWLPADDPNAVTLKWSMKQFSLDSGDSLFVVWDDSTLRDPRIDQLAARLGGKPDENGIRRGGLKQVARVVTPMAVVSRMVEHDVPRDEAIQRLEGVLVGTGAFKIRLTASGRQRSKEVTRELLAKAKAQLGVDLQVLPAARDFEATEESSSIAEEAAPTDSPAVVFDPVPLHDFQLRWKGKWISTDHAKLRDLALSLKGSPTSEAPEGTPQIEDCFQTLGSPVALSVVLSEAGAADMATVVKLIRQAAIEVGVPSEQLHLGGRPVATTALNDGVLSALWNRGVPAIQFWRKSVIGMSALVGVLVAFTMLRSLKLTLLVLFVSYFTVFVTMGLIPATGGSMNMVMVLMPTFLLVVVMSGAIHVAHYWRHAAYHNVGNAAIAASKMAGPPCLFATVTTAIGLLSLLSSSLTPARDFGIYSAVGSVIGVGAVLYLLPTLIQLVPFKPPKSSDVDATKWENFGRWCCRERHWIVWGYTLATIVCVIGLNWFRTEMKAIRFFPADAPVVQDYNFVEENLAGIVPVDVIVRFDSAAQEQRNFLERMELVRDIEQRMRKHPEISGAIALPDFSAVTARPAEESSTLAKIGYNRKATETERRIKQGDLAGTKLFFVVADKPNDLLRPGDAQLNQAGDELWRITAQCLVMSDADFAGLIQEIHGMADSVLNPHDGTNHIVTGMVPVFLHTQQALLDSQISSFGLAYLSIMIVMIFAVRNVWAGFLTMLPNVYPIGQIFGLISYCDVAIDIGTMMTASIAMGIGVDGTLHKLTWFRKGIEDGKTREDSIALAVGHSGPAIWETSAVLALGMLMLYPADLVLISRFGWLMAAIIAVAVAGDIVFLPALLGGSLGTVLIKGVKKSSIKGDSAVPQPHLVSGEVTSSLPSNTP